MSAAIEQSPANAPAPGSIFADKYRIERLLGVGGMGFVMAATHLHLHQKVAIKMLRPERVFESDTVERFLREGRAAVRIRSEHVARILDVGELPDRTPYRVMEYLDSFGSDGEVEKISDLPVRALTLQPDGRILTSGLNSKTRTLYVARYWD
jgi:serine/threonine-protein kinase